MESKSTSFVKNSFFISISLLIRALTNFLIGVGIARLYGAESFGQFSVAFTVSNIFLTLADFGFDVLLTSEIASNKENATIISKKYFSIKIILALISAILMFIVGTIIPLSETSKNLIYALILFMALTSVSNYFFAFFRGFEKFEYESKVSFLMNIILLVTIAIASILKLKLIYLIIFFILSRFIGVILSINYSKKIVNINFFELNFHDVQNKIKKVMIYGLNFIFGNLFFQLDTILIGSLLGDAQAGIYRSAFWIMILFLMIPDIIINSFLPNLSNLFVSDKKDWNFLSKLVFKILFVIVIPISIFVYSFPDLIINTIYGNNNFSYAIEILKIFSFIIFIRFIAEPFGLVITTSQRQYLRTYTVITATILILILNFLFATKYGLNAVAIISLSVNILVGFSYFILSKVDFKTWIFNKKIFSLIFLSSLFFIIILLFKNILLLILTTIFFMGLSFKMIFNENEKEYLIKTIKLKF
ncbi:MAG: oligosaccharide flippase family protein [Melioribacteraceae bacterium]|nr:oligosaccharide flippase family protein [Melioribacteraceae bacterium]